MRALAAGLLSLCLASCASERPGADSLAVMEVGLFRLPPGSHTKTIGTCEPPGPPARHDIAGVPLVMPTTRVPARLGTVFGVKFRPHAGGDAAGVANYRVVWKVPAPGIGVAPNGHVVRDDGCVNSYRIGVATLEAFRFDRYPEMALGTWTLEIWSGDRKLMEQPFFVYR